MVSSNLTGALTGAGTGALTGGKIGSMIVPGLGTGIGAGIGGLVGGIGGLFGAKHARRQKRAGGSLFQNPDQFKQFERFSPEQQNAIQQALALLTGQGDVGQGLLGQLGDEQTQIAPYLRQFREEIIPEIAERFSGIGAGAQSSSAFQQALGAAGADLSERLAAMHGERQMSLLNPLFSLATTPLTNQYYQPGGPSGFAQGLQGLLGGVGKGVGQLGTMWAANKLGLS